jgi:Fe-S cluster biogenesis protein NfuA
MFIQTEATPNPNALKFLPGREVLGKSNPKFYRKDGVDNPAERSPLAESLFEVEGVEEVFFGADFITVGKKASIEWPILKTPILSSISNFFIPDDATVVIENKVDNSTDTQLDEVTQQIVNLLDTRVRPAVAMDGGDIIFHSYAEGVVYLELHGACSGCPSSTATLKMGIENMLKHYIPEIRRVEAI